MGICSKEAFLSEPPDADCGMCCSHVAFSSTQKHLSTCQMASGGNNVCANKYTWAFTSVGISDTAIAVPRKTTCCSFLKEF